MLRQAGMYKQEAVRQEEAGRGCMFPACEVGILRRGERHAGYAAHSRNGGRGMSLFFFSPDRAEHSRKAAWSIYRRDRHKAAQRRERQEADYFASHFPDSISPIFSV